MTPLDMLASRRAGRTHAVAVHRATAGDAPAIAALVADWAAEERLLPRSAAQIALAIDDYLVATDGRGRVLACVALREYSPSLVELGALAVARDVQGLGLGRILVEAAQRLAMARGHRTIFAHTCVPGFFERVGFAEVDRSLFPEKRSRDHTRCVARTLTADLPRVGSRRRPLAAVA